MITYKRAEAFSSGTAYEMFREEYCENGCIHHKERENDGFPELLENGGCPIEDGLECGRFDRELFPNVLVSVFEDGAYLKWCHCPFFTQEGGAK